MSSSSTLPLSLIFSVNATFPTAGSPGPTFNNGLIIGSSAVIPSQPINGTGVRVQTFTSLAQMITAGFTTSSAEYLAASLYFGQPTPPTFLTVGRQDLTAIQLAAITASNAGTGYVVNDILNVVQSSASGAQYKVTSLGASGAVSYASTTATGTSGTNSITVASPTNIQVGQAVVASTYLPPNTTVLTLVGSVATLSANLLQNMSTTPIVFNGIQQINQGTGYSVAAGLATSGGTGTAAEISIISVGETPLQSLIYCRAASPLWYAAMFVASATDADYVAMAGFIEAATPASIFFLTSGAAAILNGTSGNLAATLLALGYRRTYGFYSTTQSGSFPNNAYASAAAMGDVMGLNTGTPGSFFDLCFKPITGVGPEPLTITQVQAICGTSNRTTTGLNFNAVVNYNNAFTWAQYAISVGGTFLWEVMFLDMLTADMQTSLATLAVNSGVIPQTNAGIQQVANVLSGACSRSQTIGFIANGGTWTGVSVGTGNAQITPGTPLPNGFYIYTQPITSLSTAQLNAGQFPPITVLVISAGSAHSFTVNINVVIG